jgi:hypothetical protein
MAKVGENWKCPFCGHVQVITSSRYKETDQDLTSVDVGVTNGQFRQGVEGARTAEGGKTPKS